MELPIRDGRGLCGNVPAARVANWHRYGACCHGWFSHRQLVQSILRTVTTRCYLGGTFQGYSRGSCSGPRWLVFDLLSRTRRHAPVDSDVLPPNHARNHLWCEPCVFLDPCRHMGKSRRVHFGFYRSTIDTGILSQVRKLKKPGMPGFFLMQSAADHPFAFPASIVIRRSQRAAIPWSCVTSTRVVPCSRLSANISSITVSPVA